jgi:glucosamine--fructose-6-phosphate aminotransferase (isomerizing)
MTVGYLEGVRSQPENLRRSAATVRATLSGPVGAELAALRPGGFLAIGMGASGHAAAGFATVLRDRGVPALSASAADLIGFASVFRRGAGTARPVGFGDSYSHLAISQSGRSRETVDALDAADGPRIALTNDPAGPLGRAACTVVPLGCGADSAVSTLSYTATVQALGLIADHLTGQITPVWERLPDLAASVLSGDAGPLADALDGAACVDVVGSGVHVATAGAAALLLREAAHLPTAAFSTREYLHGPLETAGPGRAVLLFGSGHSARETSLAADLAGYGARVALVTDTVSSGLAIASAATEPEPGVTVVRLPTMDGLAGCALAILPVQLAAHALAERAGRPIVLRYMPADTKLPAG